MICTKQTGTWKGGNKLFRIHFSPPRKVKRKKKGEKPFTPLTLHSAEVKERQVPLSSGPLRGSRYKATVTRTEQVWRSAARRLSGPFPSYSRAIFNNIIIFY